MKKNKDGIKFYIKKKFYKRIVYGTQIGEIKQFFYLYSLIY